MRYVLKDKRVKYWTVEQIIAYKNGASVEEVDKMADQVKDSNSEVSLNLGEYESIEHLNELAEKLESDVIKAEAELYGIEEAMETDENDWIIYFNIHTDYDLGYYIIEESGGYDTSELGTLRDYIDYEAFGRDVRIESEGGFTSLGWLER